MLRISYQSHLEEYSDTEEDSSPHQILILKMHFSVNHYFIESTDIFLFHFKMPIGFLEESIYKRYYETIFGRKD